MRSASTGAATAALSTMLVVATLSGCSGSEEASAPRPEPTTQTSPSAPPATAPPTRAEVGQVVGRLPRRKRRALVAQVTPVVDSWFDQAYVGGTWPRHVSGAFEGFTQDAARSARRDRRLTTNADLSSRIDAVRTTRRSVRYDVLAVRGRAVGVTARVVLRFRTSGQVERRVAVSGRLVLTRKDGAWKVFAYDLRKGKR